MLSIDEYLNKRFLFVQCSDPFLLKNNKLMNDNIKQLPIDVWRLITTIDSYSLFIVSSLNRELRTTFRNYSDEVKKHMVNVLSERTQPINISFDCCIISNSLSLISINGSNCLIRCDDIFNMDQAIEISNSTVYIVSSRIVSIRQSDRLRVATIKCTKSNLFVMNSKIDARGGGHCIYGKLTDMSLKSCGIGNVTNKSSPLILYTGTLYSHNNIYNTLSCPGVIYHGRCISHQDILEEPFFLE